AQAIAEGRPEANEIRLVVRGDADRVVVEVRDTGRGIAPGDLPRVLAPSFAARAGLGSGLGLTICRRLVEGLDGAIELESEPDRGTPVRVTPPTASAARDGRAPR